MRISWFHVISGLEGNGLTLRSQATELGVSLGTVYYWKSGGEPRWTHGNMLLNLYATRVSSEFPEATIGST